MRLSNSKAYNPGYTVGVHTVRIAAPLNDAVRMLQAKLDTYVNCYRIIGQAVDSSPCKIGYDDVRFIYESTITYEVIA